MMNFSTFNSIHKYPDLKRLSRFVNMGNGEIVHRNHVFYKFSTLNIPINEYFFYLREIWKIIELKYQDSGTTLRL